MHVAGSQVHASPGKAALSPNPSPLVQRRRLRAELRRARQEANLTQDAVAREMDWSLSKIIRIETGAVGVSTNDLQALLRLYGVTGTQRVRALVALAREARQQTWWSKYRDSISPAYFQFIEYETAATIIRSHEAIIVPGLLQTEEYIRAMAGLYSSILSPRAIENILEIRTQRQEQAFDRADAPLTFFTLDEVVIRRLANQPALARDQLSHLLAMAERPRVTIEIVPFTAGLSRGMLEPFVILEFEDPSDRDVLYIESVRESIFSHDEEHEITTYRELFEELREASLGPSNTHDFLEGILAEIA
jgi:transcriptional regulator with XRE-family HTH domain